MFGVNANSQTSERTGSIGEMGLVAAGSRVISEEKRFYKSQHYQDLDLQVTSQHSEHIRLSAIKAAQFTSENHVISITVCWRNVVEDCC